MGLRSDYFDPGDIQVLRQRVENIADQLCVAVSGDFNFTVKAPHPDETLDKLAMLINFVIESARRSLTDLAVKNELLQLKNRELAEAKGNLERRISERTHALKIQSDKALAANQSKDAFLANMSHEMRTPLTAIMGFVTLLNEDENDRSERSDFGQIIYRNAEHLLALIDEILDFSRIEAGRLSIERSTFSLVDLITNVVRTFGPTAQRKNIDLKMDIEPNDGEVLISDPLRLRQILVNLIGNALKFTEKGFVHVLAEVRDDQLSIEIRDTGIGIPAETQKILFSPFTQGDMSVTRKYGGTGLGLALSRRLAIALGGGLRLAHSEPGKGSAFVLHLPVEISSKGAMPDSFHQSFGADSRLLGLNILLAEDSCDNQRLFRRLLERSSATVSTANDGTEVLSLAERKTFDLVLMDIQMPVLDGYETTRRLRQAGYKKPILALTAHVLEDDLEKILEVGCTGRITKPVQYDDLILSILRHVDRSI